MERSPISNFAKAVKDDNPIYQDLRAAKAAGFDNIPVAPDDGFAFANWGQFRAAAETTPAGPTGHGGHRRPQ